MAGRMVPSDGNRVTVNANVIGIARRPDRGDAELGQYRHTPGQVPGFGWSILADAPGGTFGNVTNSI